MMLASILSWYEQHPLWPLCAVQMQFFCPVGKQEKQRVADTTARQSDVVKVDVGGTKFHASRSVLTAEPDSLLDSLFSRRFHVDTQADGSVFIDRHADVSVYS